MTRARAKRPSKRDRKGKKSGTKRRSFRRFASRLLWRGAAWTLALTVVATAVPLAALRWIAPPTSAFMLQSRFADPATGDPCERIAYRWVSWGAISPHVPRAVVVAEDQRFLEHRGFDLNAIGNAVSELAAGGRMRGASTVSQQVAKNLFLWPGQSFVRKGLEAWLTAWIELLWPKRRILEVYVNVAQFGPCVFGVEAASQRYFGRRSAHVSPLQAARLAASLPNPGRIRVDDPGPFAESRAEEIRAEMERPDEPHYLRGL